MNYPTLSRETTSPLPLVPYMLGESSEYRKSVINEVVPALLPDFESGLDRAVIDNVLTENYRRRIDEARATATELWNSLFTPKAAFRPERYDKIAEYGRFREIDGVVHPKIGDRIDLFTMPNGLTEMQAYELFAHESSGPFLDLRFARDCLRLVTQSIAAAPEITEEPALPKITRAIESDERSYRVVTTKITAGKVAYMGSIISLKSRQAGVIDYSAVKNPSDKEVIDTITHHIPTDGRTIELMQARKQLQDLLNDNPTLVTPIVESVYLARGDDPLDRELDIVD